MHENRYNIKLVKKGVEIKDDNPDNFIKLLETESRQVYSHDTNYYKTLNYQTNNLNGLHQ